MNGLEPNIWGPYYWNTLHFIAATYDNNPNQSVRSVMKNFIQSLPVFLPCKECQDNALNFIKTKNLDVVVSTRKELFNFFFNFHNRVNERLNKPTMKIEDALKQYHIPKEEYVLYSSHGTSSHGTEESSNVLNFSIVVVIILCIFWLRTS
jgi:Erv1 / Alr family